MKIDEKTAYDNAERVFMIATAARNAEMKRCLKDRYCWIEQVSLTLAGLIKIGCLFLVLKGFAYVAMIATGVSPSTNAALIPFVDSAVLILVGLVIPINPKGFFFRNVFAARAGDAFNAAADAAFNDLARQERPVLE